MTEPVDFTSAAAPDPDDPEARIRALASEGAGVVVDILNARAERARLKAEQDAKREALRRKTNPRVTDLEDWTEERLGTAVFDPVKWLVPDLLPVGVWLCSAHPKIGKSFLMTGLCRAVATGTLFCNWRPTNQGAVLYLDLEGKPRRAKDRQLRVRGAFDAGSPDFHSFFTFPSMDGNGIELLEEAIKLWSLRLIVIDIWARFRPMRAKGEDAYSYDGRSILPLLELTAKHELAIVLVHHNRKQADNDWMAEASGSTGLTGAVDGTMSIRRGRGEDTATLSISGRDVDEQELAVKFNGGLWSILGEAKEYFAGARRQTIHGILSLPRNRHGMALKDLAADAEMLPSYVTKTLRKMLADGVVSNPRRGHWMLIQPLDPVPII